ncbi:hypothetical protein QLZ26_17045 [Cronobacter universalis]|nr:hypothetical protein [Cronobacter universalis]MDI7661810.1 hypothetical protein [Cronobacter universalis]
MAEQSVFAAIFTVFFSRTRPALPVCAFGLPEFIEAARHVFRIPRQE